ncbi:MAG: LysM peptidoglycan-binding domain-containing protein [Clostridiales bacterium]|nr:LysM peptidoglycan-binding domain-containing protein [Clostridiales bacterium]
MNGTIRYTIRPYDTLWMLAQVFNTTVESLMELNPGVDPRNLQVGRVITIRPGFQYYPPYPMDDMDDFMNDMDDFMDDFMDDNPNGMLPDLRDYFRMLWLQHVMWTRMVVLGIIHDLPELQFSTQRLLRNATDFGNALVPFYGEEAAMTFENLFSQHITLAAELVGAAKAGDSEQVDAIWQRWLDNANQIAEFLVGINPNWMLEDWNAMLQEHLELLADNIMQILEQDYENAVNGFDEIESQAMEMADVMAEGIIRQFNE